MMAISTAIMPSNSVGNSDDSESPCTKVDRSRIGAEEKKNNKNESSNKAEIINASSYDIYSQLVREQLDLVVKSKNMSPFLALLSEVVKVGESGNELDHQAQQFDEVSQGEKQAVDELKLYTVLHTLACTLDKLDQRILTPIVLKLLGTERWCQVSSRVTEAFLNFFTVLISISPRWWPDVAKKMISQFVNARLDLAPHHAMLQKIAQIVPTSIGALSDVFAKEFPHKSSSSGEIMTYVSNLLRTLEYVPEQMSSVWELVIQRLIELDVECEDPDELLKRRHLERSDSSSDGSDADSDSDSDSELSISNADSNMYDDGSSSESDDGSEDEDEDEDEDLSEDDCDVHVNDGESEEISTPFQSLKRAASSFDEDATLVDYKRLKMDHIEEGDEVTGTELELAALTNVEPMAAKVDAVLSVLLEHLSVKFSKHAVQSGEATPLFKVLLHVFKKIVLPTSRLQAVQFIWFYITHVHPDLLASYLSVLLETAMSNSVSFDQRSRSMQYVASFVARAKGMTKAQVVFVVGFLADWVRRFIKEREVEVDDSLSMARFRVFYAAVQALFYIFVFRHNMLRTSNDDDDENEDDVDSHKHGKCLWEADLDKLLQQAINTKFNPLQYCQPEVVAIFARIAQNEEVASCYSIIERNRWGKFRSSSFESASGSRTNASNGLFANNRDSKLYDSFFPFQPLRLRKSKKFFVHTYEKWNDDDLSDSDTDRERERDREISDEYGEEDDEDDEDDDDDNNDDDEDSD